MGRNQARSEKCFSNRIAYIGLNKNKKLKVFKFSLPLIKVCKFETSNTEVLMFRDSVFIYFHDTKDIRKTGKQSCRSYVWIWAKNVHRL